MKTRKFYVYSRINGVPANVVYDMNEGLRTTTNFKHAALYASRDEALDRAKVLNAYAQTGLCFQVPYQGELS